MKNFKYILVVFAYFLFSNITAFAQDEVEMQRTRSDMVYIKEATGTKHIKVKLFTKDGPNFYPIFESPVKFYLQADTVKNILATVNTDLEGYADLFIEEDYKLDTNESGFYHFIFEYDGNDTCKPADGELEVKNLNVNYEYVEDTASGNSIMFTLVDDLGNPAPMENLIVYVDRMNSKLPIKDDFTDDDGKMEVAFPMDLPGDSIGDLHLTYKVAESFDYGTVYKKDVVGWGIPVDFSVKEQPRALWATNTPLWMVIAITIVLLGAWSHFFIAIYHLIKMRKSKV